MGGGVDSGSAAVIENFLEAICRDEDTPDIVIMGTLPCSEEVRAVLKRLNNLSFSVHFFQGSPMSPDDL